MREAGSSVDRIAVVDVLRAFALLGIVVTHAEMGFLAGPPPGPEFMKGGSLDEAVHRWVALLVESKFFSIFAFLFGLSFAIQLDRAREKGASFAGRFAWRLVVLLLIGMAHQLLFNGDILMLYALLGLLLIPVGRMRTGILLVAAFVLLLNVPGLLMGAARINAPPPTPEEQQANARISAVFTTGGKALYESTSAGSLGDIARTNYSHGLEMKSIYLLFTGRLWITFGCFLLGVCAWRARLFQETARSRRFFARLLVAAGVTAAATSAIVASFEPSGPGSGLWIMLATSVQQMTLAATYVAGVTWLYWWRPGGWAPHLAAVGKLGLTTYLAQSVFLALVFYGVGFGLMGDIGHAAATLLGIGFFVVQVAFASAWLGRYRLGPVEWLWRSLTDLEFKPNRLRLAASARTAG